MNAAQYTELKAPYATAAQTSPSHISLYSSYGNACAAAARATKPHRIVMGDAGYYVVCRIKAARLLVEAGYEYA